MLIAESACLPVLERVADVFELDLGWRACCDRVRAVAEEGCYCDGAVARALETSSRADAHRRVVDAVRGACGLDVSAASRREACPLVRVSASIATTNSTASEPDADSETIGMVTFREAPYAALVSAAGEAYFAFDDGRESAVSVVAGSGGAVFAVDDVRRIDVLTLPRPTLVVEPQTDTRGVDVGENLVARYENAALPGVTFEIQPPTAADANIVVALSRRRRRDGPRVRRRRRRRRRRSVRPERVLRGFLRARRDP